MAIIVQDEFTEGADTNLDAHTPTTTGTGWTKENGSASWHLRCYAAQDNVEFTETGSRGDNLMYSSQPAPTTADVDVQFDSFRATPVSNDGAWGCFARFADTSNFYSLGLYRTGVAADKKIFKRVTGTDTELASGDNGITDGDVHLFEIRDATKKLFHNSSEILSTTDNAITAAGEAGLCLGEFMTTLDECRHNIEFDDYILTEISVANAPTGGIYGPLAGPLAGPI